MKKSQITILVFAILIIFHYNSQRILGTFIIKQSNLLENIQTIEYQRQSPYTIFTGTTSNKRTSMIWLNYRKSYFNPKIKYQLYTDEGITHEQAVSIIVDNQLLDSVKSIQIILIDNYLVRKPLELNTPYWVADDGNAHYVYINFFTGEYILFKEINE